MNARRWRRVAPVLAVLLGAAMLAGCAGKSPDPGAGASGKTPALAEPGKSVSQQKIPKLDVGILGDASTLDPTLRSNSGIYLQTLGMESLLRIGADGKPEPWLAKSWRQQSDTVYEYRLRDGVTFWDGTPLTAKDVKFSWEYLGRPQSRRANFFSTVDRIDTPDAHTVKVTLKKPDASWKYTPAMYYSVVFQKRFTEEHKGDFGKPGTLVMGTGPWRFDSLNPTSGVELSANPHYWGGPPSVGKISVKFYADDNSMALALRAGEIDLAPTVNRPKGFDAAAGGNTVTTVPTCATALLSLPTQTKPWDDVHVRRAVAYAIDRKDVVAATQGRAGGALDTLISPILLRSLGSKTDVDAALRQVETYPHDLAKAKQELARSKVPNGFSTTIRAYPGANAVVEVLAAQLKKIGIKLRIEAVGDTAWFSAITGPPKDRPLTFSETGACSPDPSWDDLWLGRQNLARGALNVANYAPQDVDRLLAKGLSTQDPKQRLQVYTSLLKRLGEDVPYVPLYAEGATYASTTYDIAGYGSFWFSVPWALNVVPR